MTTKTEISEAEETRRGEMLAEVLQIRPDYRVNNRYPTAWGDKTALGLFRTIARIVEDGE